ncbi:hypothetical protein PG994_007990 [Apiospora phragmitis]|uniref:Uncharacterized protein n=1 Tax=Apiospora phragmitis TaxID=2905665 RepID=A0ABR1UUU7_9PEZI
MSASASQPQYPANEDPDAGNESGPPQTSPAARNDSAAPDPEGEFIINVEDFMEKVTGLKKAFELNKGLDMLPENWTILKGMHTKFLNDAKERLNGLGAEVENCLKVTDTAKIPYFASAPLQANLAHQKIAISDDILQDFITESANIWDQLQKDSLDQTENQVDYSRKVRAAISSATEKISKVTGDFLKYNKDAEDSHSKRVKQYIKSGMKILVAIILSLGGMASLYVIHLILNTDTPDLLNQAVAVQIANISHIVREFGKEVMQDIRESAEP